jgi:FKBP-type peptidyl-prolyl cis-trans isomerase 2
MPIKKRDFVEIEYTGKLKEEDIVFDTTDEEVAKKNNLHNHGASFGPVIICVGEEQILKGIDKTLEGKDTGKEYETDIVPEDAFGNKNAKLIQLIPTSKFKKQNVQPLPGMQVNIDGMVGTIKTVSGGRTLVDFNHPLAGKVLSYKIKVNRLVTDDKERLDGYAKLSLGLKDFNAEINGENASIAIKTELPQDLQVKLKGKIMAAMPKLKHVEFTIAKELKNK